MPVYQYRCPKGHLSQKIKEWEHRTTRIDCQQCGLKAEYIISAPSIDHLHVGLNSDRWAKIHEQHKPE